MSRNNKRARIEFTMKQEKHSPVIRVNLVLSSDFYNVLKMHADNEYVRVGTWTKSYLLKNLNPGDKKFENFLTHESNK